MESSDSKLKIAIAVMLIVLGVVGRFIIVTYLRVPNLEIVTALSLVAGIYIGGAYAVAVPLSIILLSDLVIGNSYIFIFTWTAFALIGLLGHIYNKKICCDGEKAYKLRDSIHLAIISSVFFYLFTNFGWWLMSGMYEYSLSGILRCYYMAIPFFRNNLIGNLIFVPFSIFFLSKIMYSIKSRNDIAIKSKNCLN